MSGPSRPSASTLQLTLRLTTHPLYPVPTNYHILVERTDTVARLKRQIHSEWEGKPLPEGIVCIKGGRVCRDLEVIGELFPPEVSTLPLQLPGMLGEGVVEEAPAFALGIVRDYPRLTTYPPQASHPDLVLHVIVKPNSWSAPFTSLPPPTPTTSAPPAPVAAPIASPALAPASPSAGYHPAYTVTPPVEPTPPSPETLRNAFTTDLGLGGAIPTPTPATAPNPSPSLGPLVSGFPTYLAYLSQLIPLQRSLLLLNLQKAHYFYSIDVTERMARLGWAESTGSRIDPIVAREEGEEESAFSKREEREKERMRREMEEGNGEVQEVKGLLIECGLWGMVKEKEEEAEVEIRNWGVARPEGNGEFQLVQVGCVHAVSYVAELC